MSILLPRALALLRAQFTIRRRIAWSVSLVIGDAIVELWREFVRMASVTPILTTPPFAASGTNN